MLPRQHSLALARGISLCALIFGVLSCDGGEAGKRAGSEGRGVVIGILNEPKSLNPLVATSVQSHDVINLMFERLLIEQADFLTFSPGLAQSWSFGADSLSITFRLREGLRWHDGQPVTAEDIRFTWQRQSDPRTAWASRSIKDRIVDVEVVDNRTATFHFAQQYRYQLHDANDGVVLPKHILESIPPDSMRSAEFSRNPVGTGPFRFSRWVSGQYIELARNRDYYIKGRPFLERVAYRVVPDMTNLANQLKAGEIDCLESLPIDILDDLRKDYPEIRIYQYMSRGMTFVVWNLEKDLFADRELRRAFAMAINAEEIIETLLAGMARIADSPMHPMLWAYDPDGSRIPYNPEEALAILNRLGWTDSDNDGVLDRDGRPLEFSMTTNQGVQLRVDIMTMVQEYLRHIGVKVNARVLEWNAFMDGVVGGDFDSCVLGWRVGTRVDLTSFWHSEATPPNGFNAARYKNREVDELIGRARNTLDTDVARHLWKMCQRLIYEDQPIFFVAVPYELVGLRRDFCGVEPNAHGFFVNIADWYVGDDCAE